MRDFSEFFEIQRRLLASRPKKYERYLLKRIDRKQRLIGIIGGRGTGKSTMLLQLLAESELGEQALYLSADHVRVEAEGLYELASAFLRQGGQFLLIDEVHKSSAWARVVKSLYDSFPDARLAFSGSSAMKLQAGKVDLSRRAVFYHLPAMSFREYLLLAVDRRHSSFDLGSVFAHQGPLAAEILSDGPILGHFKDYLDHGAYPFVLEGVDAYLTKLHNVVEKVLYEDITSSTGMRVSGVPVLKRILWRIASSPPHELNTERLSSDLGIAKQTLYNYLDYLERAGLIMTVLPAGSGSTVTRRGSKLMLANTNLIRAIGRPLDLEDQTGTLRETFFAAQLAGAGQSLRAPRKGDFQLASGTIIEIGGRKKTRRQVASHPDAYIVKDDIEVGSGRTVPLWLFGFLY